MKKKLNLKQMMNTYAETQCDNEVWRSFYVLYKCGFITRELWVKFYDKCKSWHYVEENDDEIISGFVLDEDGKLIHLCWSYPVK